MQENINPTIRQFSNQMVIWMPEEYAIHGAANAVFLEFATVANLALENLMLQNAKLASKLITQSHKSQKHALMQLNTIDVKFVGLEHLDQLRPLSNEILIFEKSLL